MKTNKIKRIVHNPIADFVSSFRALFRENEVSHWTLYNKVKVVLLSRNKTLLKLACFEKFYRPKIHLETAQKLPNDHFQPYKQMKKKWINLVDSANCCYANYKNASKHSLNILNMSFHQDIPLLGEYISYLQHMARHQTYVKGDSDMKLPGKG